MKKLIVLLSACLLISLMGFTEKIASEKVPTPVKQAFAKKFSDAINVNYEIKKKYYQVTFKDNGDRMSANFNSMGEWMKTETEINETDLPKEVSTFIAKNFTSFSISEISQIDTPDKILIYKMNLRKDKVGYELQFSPKGDVLKKTKLKKA